MSHDLTLGRPDIITQPMRQTEIMIVSTTAERRAFVADRIASACRRNAGGG